MRLCVAGDLLAALLLAWLHKRPDNMAAAIEAAVSSLQGVLRRTAEACPPATLANPSESTQVQPDLQQARV